MTKNANQLKQGDFIEITIDGEKMIFQVKRIFSFQFLDYCFIDLSTTGKKEEDQKHIYGNFGNNHKFKIAS